MSTILILGGGFGGLSCASELRRLLSDEHKIIVVDQSSEFVIGATKPWVMLGDMDSKTAAHSRQKLNNRGIEFVQARVNSIDSNSRSVETSVGKLQADYLVVALGAELDMWQVRGLGENAHSFYDLAGAIKLHETLKEFKGGEVVLLIPKAPFKCPPAPYESALLLADHLKRRKIPHKLTVATVEGAPMATAGPEIGAFVRDLMQTAGITYLTLKKTLSVDGYSKRVRFEDGELGYDLLIAVPPHVPPRVILESSLKGPNGWIPIDRESCRLANPQAGVFAIGDCTVSLLPGKFKPDAPLVLPKAGVFADRQGIVVAQNIALAMRGQTSRVAYDGKGFCYIETGDMHAARGDGSFFDLPHPTMERHIPDMNLYDGKREWIKGLVERFLGS